MAYKRGSGRPFKKGVGPPPKKPTEPPKPGEPYVPRFKTPKMAKMILAEIVDWEEFWTICYKEFKGGYTYVNGVGNTVTARPSIEWARFLAEYGQHKMSDEAPMAAAEELKVLSKAIADYLLPPKKD